jgi:N-succinyldiaminopimelate aminotransferase
MNPGLSHLQSYPFEKLRLLLDGISPPADHPARRLSIGEPQHPTPAFIKTALAHALDDLARYPQTQGERFLRLSIAQWLARRYGIPLPDPDTQIIPTLGSREALFAIAQCVLSGDHSLSQGPQQPLVLMPNPFYQIYEGAALLGGAKPVFYAQTDRNHFQPDFAAIAPDMWSRIGLVYVCSPGNPTGHVLSMTDWEILFERADRHGFVIAADECYSEIYPEGRPPLGALQAAYQLGRVDYRRLLIFSSLSKRSNVPGLRSGFVAGERSLIASFLRYRTYHGCAMSPAVQAASRAAWDDETHVQENRRLYAQKFAHILPLLGECMAVSQPDAGFYLWAKTPGDDAAFVRSLYANYNVTLLPGRFLARDTPSGNPGDGFVRIALVPSLEDCILAAQHIRAHCHSLASGPRPLDQR